MTGRRQGLGWAFGLALVVFAVLGVLHTTQAQAGGEAFQQTAVTRALRYLALQQGVNGGFGSIGATSDVVIAAASAERDAAAFGLNGRPGALAALVAQTQATTRTLNAGEVGKLALAAVAADADGRAFGGLNLPLSLTNALSATGAYDAVIFNHTLALLGVAASGETVPLSATSYLTQAQQANGGWDDGYGSGVNVDSTALAVQALLVAGVPPTDTSIISATHYLSATHNDDGGWPFQAGSATNANSTAFAIQALRALKQDYTSPTSTWAVSNTTPLSALLALQLPSGGFAYEAGQAANAFATWQAIPALQGQAFPIVGRREAARRALAWLKTQQQADGSFPEFAGGTSANGAARAVRAIRAAGQDPQGSAWNGISGTNVVSALEVATPQYLVGGRGGRVGNIMRGVVAAGAPYTVTSFAGRNLVVSMTGFLSPSGQLDNSPFAHSLAMLGLQEAGFFSGTLAQSATTYLSDTAVITGSPDGAGLALQALASAGVPREAASVERAIAFLLGSQLGDGGWGFGGASNANSTSEATRGLLAYGVEVRQLQRAQNGRLASPLGYLIDAQQRNGAIISFGNADPFATTDAIFAYTAAYPSQEFPLVLRERRLALVLK
jgi:prenyltransferase beta subunit/predicted DNA-binding protein with PD1-like motif